MIYAKNTIGKVRWRLGIRAKMQIAVAVSLVLLATVIFAFVRNIVFASYARLESEDVRLTVERVANADDQLCDLLYERQFDWASWDDAYQFVKDGNTSFAKTNLGSAELVSNKIDFTVFVRRDGTIVNAASAARSVNPGKPLVNEIIKEIGLDSVAKIRELTKRHGITILHQGVPLNIGIRAISKTNGSGGEVGWLAWGQYVMKDDLRRIANNLKVTVYDMPYLAATKEWNYVHAVGNTAGGKQYKSIAISANTFYVYHTILDYRQRPIWVQRITVPRNFHAQGITTFETLLKWLVFGSFLFCCCLFLAIDFIFLRRLRNLSKALTATDDPKAVQLPGNDELSDLADTFRDTLTALNARKSELGRVNENLEGIIQERTLDLTRAIKEAERANAAKSEFLSHMSHELRTPLNAVIGFAQLLQMRAPDSKTVDSADAILKAGKHLLDLVNEILDLARIESGKLTVSVEPIFVGSTLKQAVSLIQPCADARGILVNLAPPDDSVCIQADHQRLLQVILNVLSNAIKYNRPNGSIDIRCRQNSDRFRIEVEDTGFGIDDEGKERLFVPFERLGDQVAEGTGLGLALSRNLTQLMGGDLCLLSSNENGSVFAIDFVPSEAASLSLSTSVAESLTTTKDDTVTIVYLEDNVSNLELMASIIGDLEGFELRSATRASQGLNLIRQILPDVILLDANLPGAEGADVVKELKSNPATRDIPIIVLSADNSETKIREMLDAGARKYLTKPIDLSILLAELAELEPRRRQAA